MDCHHTLYRHSYSPLEKYLNGMDGTKFDTDIHGSLKFKISHIWAGWIAFTGCCTTTKICPSVLFFSVSLTDTHTVILTPKGPPSFDEDSSLGNLCFGVKWANRRNMHTLTVTQQAHLKHSRKPVYVAGGAKGQGLHHCILPVHTPAKEWKVKSSAFCGQPSHFLPSCHGD